MKQRALKPWHGVVFFVIVMAIFFLIGVPIQTYLGIYGVAVTELMLLILALIFVKVMGYSWKTLLPVQKPRAFALLGTILIWIGAYLIDLVVMLIQYRLFPIQTNAVNAGLNDVIYSVPFLISVVIVSILPAICEEAVHRGVIIHTLYTIRKEWLVVLIMGIYFGLFHTDPIRFLPTAILGAAISYIMLETENIVYASFFHFVNNFFPLLLQQLLSLFGSSNVTTNSSAVEVPIASIGLYMMFATITPFLLYLGHYLLHYKKGASRPFFPKEKRLKIILWIVIPTLVLLVVGWILMLFGILFDPVFSEIMNSAGY